MDERTQLFRQVMGRFATGVSVVTTRLGDVLQGVTVSALISVSLEPLLVLVSIERKSRSHDLILESGIFAVSILSEEQTYLSDLFAGRYGSQACRFERLAYRTEATGAPLLEGAIARLDCRLAAAYEGGDHTLFLGAVEWMDAREGEPLLYYRGGYRVLAGPQEMAIAA